MTSFSPACDFVIDALEGGGVVVLDSGGLTKWGISKKAHPDVDIENLTRDDAIEIYRRDYWDRLNLDRLPPSLALLVFDCGVNMGVEQAAVFLQNLVYAKADGIIGDKTVTAVRNFSSSELRARYGELRLRHYEELARTKPFFYPSLYGWRLRCFRVADEAGKWASREGEET